MNSIFQQLIDLCDRNIREGLGPLKLKGEEPEEKKKRKSFKKTLPPKPQVEEPEERDIFEPHPEGETLQLGNYPREGQQLPKREKPTEGPVADMIKKYSKKQLNPKDLVFLNLPEDEETTANDLFQEKQEKAAKPKKKRKYKRRKPRKTQKDTMKGLMDEIQEGQ